MPLGRAKLLAMLPKVGEHRMERPTIDENTRTQGSPHQNAPQPCVVIEVNRAHLWYTVQFENGFRESYKVPKLRDPIPGGGLL